MTAPTELYLDPLPDMGELGPSNLRFTHAPCHVRMRFHAHPLPRRYQLKCPKCGQCIDLSDAMLDEAERAAILRLPGPVRSTPSGQAPDVFLTLRDET